MPNIKNRLSGYVRSLWKGRNLVLFAFFLLISCGFWFLNALRKTYTAHMVFSVEYINLPQEALLMSNAPKTVQLKVRGTGFTLIRYNLGANFNPLLLDVSKMKKYSFPDKRGAFMGYKELVANFSVQLSNDLDLMEVKPDTIFVEYLRKKSSKVPVKFKGKLSFKQPFYQSGGVKLSPDSVVVSGPEDIVDTLTYIESKNFESNDIQDTVHSSVSLDLPYNIVADLSKISVIIPSEPYTESAVDVPLMVKGAPLGTTVKTFPTEVHVTFRVSLSKFEKINSGHFLAVVDMTDVDVKATNKLKIKIEKVPSYIYSVEYSPVFVTYLIENLKDIE